MSTVFAPAKLNLHLRVICRRPDGYHDIATLMQKIDLSDTLTFRPRHGGVMLRCPGFPQLENEDNLVFRAVKALFAVTGCSSGVEIVLQKRIPLGAGLGGGSSDAATTLVTLNEILGLGMTTEGLMRIAARLGADVPFFLYGNRAWAFGIGDLLEPVVGLPPLWFVLVNPGFELSTRQVYEGLNLRLTKKAIHYSIPQLSSMSDVIESLYNDLEKVSFALHPALRELKEKVVEAGALGALMSGSGPTIYGVFGQENEALRAAGILQQNGNGFVKAVASL